MKKTELIFILDRSGSMSGLEEDTIGGYNSMLKKQQSKKGEVIVTTVLFDHEYEIVHDRTNLKEIKALTKDEYFVRGSTALLDAVGMTINKIINSTKNTKDDYRPDKCMFVIITDGMENSSREYTYSKIKAMIEKQKKDYNWEFIFLGANIDALATAEQFGINEDRAANYKPDKEGTILNYEVVSDLIVELRSDNKISDNWKEKIDDDFSLRGYKNNI